MSVEFARKALEESLKLDIEAVRAVRNRLEASLKNGFVEQCEIPEVERVILALNLAERMRNIRSSDKTVERDGNN